MNQLNLKINICGMSPIQRPMIMAVICIVYCSIETHIVRRANVIFVAIPDLQHSGVLPDDFGSV